MSSEINEYARVIGHCDRGVITFHEIVPLYCGNCKRETTSYIEFGPCEFEAGHIWYVCSEECAKEMEKYLETQTKSCGKITWKKKGY